MAWDVMQILRLVRYKNLLIIALTQYMMRLLVVRPILNLNNFRLQVDGAHFFLLVLSSMLIAAAGYVINDYFDTKTDMMNRPETVLVGTKISRKSAMSLHIILNIPGIALGIYLSVYAGIPVFGMGYLIAAGLLWFYSTTYKRQFLTGNLLVALFTAVVPFLVVIFEVPLLNVRYREVLLAEGIRFYNVLGWVGGFSYFAFLSTLIREIIKDMEDIEGDLAYGRNSLPVVLGIGATRHVVAVLVTGLVASLVWIYFRFLVHVPGGGIDYLSASWLGGLVILPCIYLVYRVYRSASRKDFHFCSAVSKGIMLAGILYSVVAFIVLRTNFS